MKREVDDDPSDKGKGRNGVDVPPFAPFHTQEERMRKLLPTMRSASATRENLPCDDSREGREQERSKRHHIDKRVDPGSFHVSPPKSRRPAERIPFVAILFAMPQDRSAADAFTCFAPTFSCSIAGVGTAMCPTHGTSSFSALRGAVSAYILRAADRAAESIAQQKPSPAGVIIQFSVSPSVSRAKSDMTP